MARNEKIFVGFMKIYGQSHSFLFKHKSPKIWHKWLSFATNGSERKICVRFMKIYGPSIKSIRIQNFCDFSVPKNWLSARISLHPAAVSLDQIEISFGRRSWFGTFVETEAPHLPPLWSRQYLCLPRPSLTARPSSPSGRPGEAGNTISSPTRTATTALFSPISGSPGFMTGNSDFRMMKAMVSCHESAAFVRALPAPFQPSLKCKILWYRLHTSPYMNPTSNIQHLLFSILVL